MRNRISRRDSVELTEELFQARLSTGTVDSVLSRVAGALAEPHEDLLHAVRSSQHLNIESRFSDRRYAPVMLAHGRRLTAPRS